MQARRIASAIAIGAVAGAVLIGGGARAAMRILALSSGLPTGFSMDGTLEILLYGALVGAAGGILCLALLRTDWPRPVVGLATGALTFAGTILFLPPHIAQTAEPFRPMLALVLALFGAGFAGFGLLVALLLGHGRGPDANGP